MLPVEQTKKKRKITGQEEFIYNLIVRIVSYLSEFKDYMKLCQLNRYYYKTLLDINNSCFKNALQNGMYISLWITTAIYYYEIGGYILKLMEHGHYAKVVGVVSDNLENLLLEHGCKLKFVKDIIINEYYLDHVRYICELISRGLFPSLEKVVIDDEEYFNYKEDFQRMIKSGVYPVIQLNENADNNNKKQQALLIQHAIDYNEEEEEIEIELSDSEEEEEEIEISRNNININNNNNNNNNNQKGDEEKTLFDNND
ncbi:hypothetical protein ABK040_014908 [Willaertia magna]